MNKIKMTKFSLMALVLALALSFAPAGAMAQSTANLDVNVDLLGKAKVLDIVEVGGNCKSIYAKVKVGTVTKALGQPGLANVVNNLKIEVPYEIYWYPKAGNVSGELVADGKVQVKGDNETITIRYVPAKNPNGPAGIYAIKVKLAINDQKLDNLTVVARVKVNGPCPANGGDDNDNNGGNNDDNNNGGDNNNGNNNDGNHNDGNNNDGNHNDGNNNNGNNNDGNQGGPLPKTATGHPNGAVAGIGLLLVGLVVLLISRRMKAWQ